jgi:hypothetical protein
VLLVETDIEFAFVGLTVLGEKEGTVTRLVALPPLVNFLKRLLEDFVLRRVERLDIARLQQEQCLERLQRVERLDIA